MPVAQTAKKIARFLLGALSAVSFLAPLATRLLIGSAFYQTGKGKLAHLDKITEFFTGLGIPFPHANAVFIAWLEYLGGMLLIAGLATRPVAALLGSTMIVALITADRESLVNAWNGVDDKGLTDVVPVVFGLFLLWLLLYGAGALSLDSLIRKWLFKNEPADGSK